MPEPYDDEQETKLEYRRFGAGEGLPRSIESIQNLNIFYLAVVAVVVCILAIIVSITIATCLWILDI